MSYSFLDLEQALENAGMPAPAAVIGAAIGLAESSGNPNAVGDLNIPGSRSVGVWQINLPYHPDVTEACARDLNCAAAAATRISNNGTDWSAWTTFTSGKYLQYLPGGAGGSSSDGGTTTTSGSGGNSTTGLSLPNPFSGVEGALKQAGFLALGGVLLLSGVLLLAISSGSLRSVVNVTPQGRALSAAGVG